MDNVDPYTVPDAGVDQRKKRSEYLKKIVFASRNHGKINEIRAMLADSDISLVSLEEYPHIPQIVENGISFLENALIKAKTVAEATGEIALADDSGLEVDALDGAPGIRSARYAGQSADDAGNIRKLLHTLRKVPSEKRGAQFRCVLALYSPTDGCGETFEGCWRGVIAEEPVGCGGFGHDPIFFLPDLGMTVAELSPEVKNRLSHRAQAAAKLKKKITQRS